MTTDIPDSPARLRARLRADLAARGEAGRLRTLRVAAPVRVNLADNDYLGLATDPAVLAAARTALENGPLSASSSPLVRGYQSHHAALEKALCAWHGFSHGLIWNSGFSANQAILGTLVSPGDLILADRLVHHSLIAGILKSGATFTRVAHNDLDALDTQLRKPHAKHRIRWVVTESVYSMDGDGPDLARLAALKRQHGFVWMLDEAHALGWYGPQGQGCAASSGVVKDVDVFIGTLGKALGGMGAYALFHDHALRESLINHAGEFIYSTYLAPPLAAAATVAIERARMRAGESAAWRDQSHRFREALRQRGWNAPPGDSPIVPIIIGTDAAVLALGQHLLQCGFAVGAIRPPTVPENTARLRISLKADTIWEDLDALMREMERWRESDRAVQ